MGEEVKGAFSNGLEQRAMALLDSELDGHQTVSILRNKIYLIGGDSVGVRIFDLSTEKWIVPSVLGTKPASLVGHSAVILGEERILVLKRNSPLEDCVWFLEVNTAFIREQRKKYEGEAVAWSKGVEERWLKPVVVSGPSGVGKGTLISRVMADFPSTFGFSVSHTTRLPRERESDGVHYHFIEKGIMEREIKDGKFLEYASVHGNLYGTSIRAVEAVMDEGKRCILDIDVQGAKSVRASSVDALFIFICPPSFEELERRLRSRGTETEEQIQKRLRNARAELEQGKNSGIFDHLLVNDDLESCYASFKKLLGLEARKGRAQDPGNKLRGPVSISTCFDITEVFLSAEKVNVLSRHSVSERDGKILIHSGPDASYAIDVRRLRGGAPGVTRGLKIHPTVDS